MRSVARHLSYANVISTLCLFVLLGGGAYAAATQLPAKSVGAKQLKTGAVTGVKIKDGTITGAKIDSRTLGTVPTATSAERAAFATNADRAAVATKAELAVKADLATKALDAETLAGASPAAFVNQSQVAYVDREFSGCTISVLCASDVVTIGGVTFRAICENAAGIAGIVVRTVGGAQTGYSYVSESSTARHGRFFGDGNVIAVMTTNTEVTGATGTIVVRTPARIISFSFDATARAPTISSAACTLFGTALAV